MKWKKIDKIHQGKFVTRYDITYETVDKRKKVYEMISRNPHIKTQEDLYEKAADAVVLIMHNREDSKVLLNKEFRLAVGEFVYNFPAGLIDAGETPVQSARRELKEEGRDKERE